MFTVTPEPKNSLEEQRGPPETLNQGEAARETLALEPPPLACCQRASRQSPAHPLPDTAPRRFSKVQNSTAPCMLGVVNSVEMHIVWPDITSANGCVLFQQDSHESQIILTLEAPWPKRTGERKSRFTTHLRKGLGPG